MTAQELIDKLLSKMDQLDALRDRENTKIYMPAIFAHRLDRDLGIRAITSRKFEGYSVVFSTSQTISAYNAKEDVKMVIPISDVAS